MRGIYMTGNGFVFKNKIKRSSLRVFSEFEQKFHKRKY